MLELNSTLLQELYHKGISKEALQELTPSEPFSLILELLELQGLSLQKHKNLYRPKAFEKSIKEETFCIVDIETNGSKKSTDQVIEIGAIKIKNGEVIDTFNSLLKSDTLPDAIAKLTSISQEELQNAPAPKAVMQQFKLFLGDAVFVAHALKFDYDFISEMFERAQLGKMYNIGLCTIDLAERTFQSQKYGLKFLNETLFNEPLELHRAFNDALLTSKLFGLILDKLPKEVQSVKELHTYSKQAPKMKRIRKVISSKKEEKEKEEV